MSDSQNTALLSAAEEIEKGHPWISAVAASAIIRKHLQHAQQADVEAVAEIHSGTLRWLVGDDHPVRECGHAYLFTRPAASVEGVAWMTDDGRVISAQQKAVALRHGGASASSVAPFCIALVRPAASSTKQPLSASEGRETDDFDIRELRSLVDGFDAGEDALERLIAEVSHLRDDNRRLRASQQGGVPEAVRGEIARNMQERNRHIDMVMARYWVDAVCDLLTAMPSTAGADAGRDAAELWKWRYADRRDVIARWHARAVELGYDGVEELLAHALPSLVNSGGDEIPPPATAQEGKP